MCVWRPVYGRRRWRSGGGGPLLDRAVLVAGVACVPGSHVGVAICEVVLGRLPPGAGQCIAVGGACRLSVKAACLPALELWPEGRAHPLGPVGVDVLSGK